MNKGAYILILKLERTVVSTAGKSWQLAEGYYAYVGSAMGTLTGRLKHHLEPKKSYHWHIDRLEPDRHVVAAILVPSESRIEEWLSNHLSLVGKAVIAFGCSDSGVDSNLFKIDHEIACGLLTKILHMRREKL